ncbi:hypothetical protein P168DRAFT_96080 [Aspergillus campestris IBT 28561]|uniref:Uncharacterized protein n=1 Tax=Aspergillus campestris (strain IBT 28561) TaxID=1392248 RepID=A0A2I1DC18_ASPC2|nr:uncharacterized protein P168DRAFT_96080 [Aspergillus campestris IBT 28561]PKY07432.1 hypothetical protein P168DRAFT_96080 [Aspergillus campestris IBT 28561]
MWLESDRTASNRGCEPGTSGSVTGWRRRQFFRSNCALTQRDVLTARLASANCLVVTSTATVDKEGGHIRANLILGENGLHEVIHGLLFVFLHVITSMRRTRRPRLCLLNCAV